MKKIMSIRMEYDYLLMPDFHQDISIHFWFQR